MNNRIKVYQNKAGNDILHALLTAGCKEDVAMIADFLMSAIIELNSVNSPNQNWIPTVDLNLNSIAEMVYPKGSGPSSDAVTRSRRKYKTRLDAAYNTLHAIEQPISVVSAATCDGYAYKVTLTYDIVARLQEAQTPSPLVVHREMYQFGRKRSIHAFSVNRFLLLDRKMNYEQRQNEYIMPFNLLYRFTTLPPFETATHDNRGWRRGMVSWVDYTLRPAIEGCGAYTLLDVTSNGVHLVVTSKQLEVEQQK